MRIKFKHLLHMTSAICVIVFLAIVAMWISSARGIRSIDRSTFQTGADGSISILSWSINFTSEKTIAVERSYSVLDVFIASRSGPWPVGVPQWETSDVDWNEPHHQFDDMITDTWNLHEFGPMRLGKHHSVPHAIGVPVLEEAWIAVPVWLPLEILGIWPMAVMIIALVRRRRHPAGHCRCGYDLRASPGRCPECGDSAPATLKT